MISLAFKTSAGLLKRCAWHITRRQLADVADLASLERVRLRDKTAHTLCRKSVDLHYTGQQYSVLLDGRLLESPLGNVLGTPSRSVAERVVAEWRERLGQLTRFETLPMTMLLAETVDMRPDKRASVVSTLVDALDFDTALRFHPQPEVPLEMLAGIEELDSACMDRIAPLDLDVLQSTYLLPILRAFAQRRGTSALVASGEIASSPRQPADVVDAVRSTLLSYSAAQVVVVKNIHRRLKSIVLPLELLDGAIDTARAVRASRLEETLQAASWGVCADFREQECIMVSQIGVALEFWRAHVDSTSLM
ncbi:ATP synthase mitochondrial F1 complex assembly protein [Babesia ovata]|uniref:ATP synthase mitochondrial F1 complex assembly protein n=1 Tax=Babesia ovata TaxID=189622 RepID=A0A2H6KGB4_9APIC|nr:ATP synthase mitochondrial F1 complex assembly protein [Babesia ovata]GBE62038.1 ATP synthase mitochondrial F1 complex assembly protein [Babesia ovata]